MTTSSTATRVPLSCSLHRLTMDWRFSSMAYEPQSQGKPLASPFHSPPTSDSPLLLAVPTRHSVTRSVACLPDFRQSQRPHLLPLRRSGMSSRLRSAGLGDPIT